MNYFRPLALFSDVFRVWKNVSPTQNAQGATRDVYQILTSENNKVVTNNSLPIDIFSWTSRPHHHYKALQKMRLVPFDFANRSFGKVM